VCVCVCVCQCVHLRLARPPGALRVHESYIDELRRALLYRRLQRKKGEIQLSQKQIGSIKYEVPRWRSGGGVRSGVPESRINMSVNLWVERIQSSLARSLGKGQQEGFKKLLGKG
jgi:hypothetical protein